MILDVSMLPAWILLKRNECRRFLPPVSLRLSLLPSSLLHLAWSVLVGSLIVQPETASWLCVGELVQ